MTNVMHICFILQYIYYIPLHVSSIICSSSGGWTVLMQHLVSSSQSVAFRCTYRLGENCRAQRDAHLLYFTIYLLYSSTCFEHNMLIIKRLKYIDAASGIVLSVSGRPVHRLGENWFCSGWLHSSFFGNAGCYHLLSYWRKLVLVVWFQKFYYTSEPVLS